MARKKRILIASGGTGGHFYPGFALAEEMRKRGFEVLFIVKKDDISISRLNAADFPYAETDMRPLPRSINPLRQAVFFGKLAGSVALSLRIIKDFGPDAAVGTGSYIGFPAILAAYLLKVPVFIHESNSVPGIGNRLAMPLCRKAALGIPLKDDRWPGKTELIGTPIRGVFANAPGKKAARKELRLDADKFTVLAFGGSQGASRLNAAVISSFLVLKDRMQLIHLTGEKNFSTVRNAYADGRMLDRAGLKLFPYYENMPLLYGAADLVVSRAGASTIAELSQLSKPAVLVPLPSAAGDHQKHNAAYLHKYGACAVVEETEMFFRELENKISGFIGDAASVSAMSDNYRKAGLPDGAGAAARMSDLIENNI